MGFKGINAINKILNEFLEEFEATADMGTDFCYWNTDGLIHYALVISEGHNDYFMENFNRLAPDIKCDVFLASFLHELGHHETISFIEDVDELYCRDVKHKLSQELENKHSEEETKALYQRYFDLPDEYEATMWAIEYIRENSEKVATLWEKLQKVIIKFYEINRIEVDVVGC